MPFVPVRNAASRHLGVTGDISKAQEVARARAVSPFLSGPVTHDPILVSRFVPCTCGHNTYEGLHASIDIFPVELCQGNAVALSYAIGDFDPKHKIIGHRYGKPADPITLNLGAEWDVADVRERLVELSQEHNAVWVDQLCIQQEPEQIQIMLGKVPSIYSTFDVVILLPGSLCICVPEFISRSETDRFSENELISQSVNMIESCRSSTGFCSYFDRIWTRSEVLYSRSIRIIWSKIHLQSCVKFDESKAADADEQSAGQDPEEDSFFCLREQGSEQALSPYAQQQFIKECKESALLYEDQNPRDYAEIKHFQSQVRFLSSVENFLYYEHQQRFRQPNEVQFGKLEAIQFLAGQPLQQYQPPELKIWEVTERFTFDLGYLRDSDRIATSQLDYVLAIWPDFPGYQIPGGYQNLVISELLENAIIQYERLTCESPAVQLPAGLFRDTSPSGVWRPTLYLNNQSIKCAGQVYGATLDTCIGLDCTPDGFVLLKTRRKRTLTYKSRLARATTYFDSNSCSSTANVLRFMRTVVVGWPKNTGFVLDLYYRHSAEGVRILEGISPPPKEGWPHPGVGMHVFLEKLFTEKYMDKDWADLPEIDHHDLVYNIVAERFKLDAQICRANNLQLMVADGISPHIGFTKLPSLKTAVGSMSRSTHLNSVQRALGTVKQLFSSSLPQESLSIAIDSLSARSTVYEAVRVKSLKESLDSSDQEEVPQYRVVGVWLESKNLCDEEIGAWPRTRRESWDALLV